MTNKYIAAYGQITYPEDDNDWLTHKDFKKTKTSWKKFNNNPTKIAFLK